MRSRKYQVVTTLERGHPSRGGGRRPRKPGRLRAQPVRRGAGAGQGRRSGRSEANAEARLTGKPVSPGLGMPPMLNAAAKYPCAAAENAAHCPRTRAVPPVRPKPRVPIRLARIAIAFMIPAVQLIATQMSPHKKPQEDPQVHAVTVLRWSLPVWCYGTGRNLIMRGWRAW